MKFAVLRFPGSNCDQDCIHALAGPVGARAEIVWHKETSLAGFDAVVVPGGFSYGDYLRCGAIARFSPIMQAVKAFAREGGPVLGICNGFQILCEARLLPGVLIRNRSLNFICRYIHLKVEQSAPTFTSSISQGAILKIPIAHGEGNYVADPECLRTMNENGRILLRYSSPTGETSDAWNPNGSMENIAGIVNEAGNVFGLMPHPERACEEILGSTDGLKIFASMLGKTDPAN